MQLIVGLIALLMLCACQPKAPSQVAADVFPTAAEVRLYINPQEISIDDKGKPNKGSYPKKGIRLTSAEIDTLRKSIYYTRPPKAFAACCIPRHSFLFYDKRGKYLGEITVCFECSCIDFSDAKPPSRALKHVAWDYDALGSIVKAHGQKTEFEYDLKPQ